MLAALSEQAFPDAGTSGRGATLSAEASVQVASNLTMSTTQWSAALITAHDETRSQK